MLRKLIGAMIGILLLLCIVHTYTLAPPDEPHNANAMWIEPSKMNFSRSVPSNAIGCTFIVTIWLNISSSNVFGYQVALRYNCSLLHCVGAGFTDGVTSEFMAGHVTVTGGPVIDESFLGDGSVFAFESCLGGDYVPADPLNPHVDSLMWIEFEITYIPPLGGVEVSRIDITGQTPTYNWVTDPNSNGISIIAYDSTYMYDSRVICINQDGSVSPPGTPISSSVLPGGLNAYTFGQDIFKPIIIQRDHVVLDGNLHKLQGSRIGYGVSLDGRADVTIRNVEVRNFTIGIFLESCHDIHVLQNNLTTGFNGIVLQRSSQNIVAENNVTQNDCNGIVVHTSSDRNLIERNNATTNGYNDAWPNDARSGIVLEENSFNTVAANNVIGNQADGIFVCVNSYNNTLSENAVVDNGGFGIDLWYSSNNTLSDNYAVLNDNGGVGLDDSSNNTLSGNMVIENEGDGLSLIFDSNRNILLGNNLTRNSGEGIYVWGACDNVLSRNVLEGNDDGICLTTGSDGTAILENNITGSHNWGIWLEETSGNRIYHNNFYDMDPVHISVATSVWDDGYPSGGNYWSGCSNVDVHSGPDQNRAGRDGINDTQHSIDANNVDHYPLVNPWNPMETYVTSGSTNYPVTITSNATIQNMNLSPGTLSFQVQGSTGTRGYVLVVISMDACSPPHTPPAVFLDNVQLLTPPLLVSENQTHYFIYFDFSLSTHDVNVRFSNESWFEVIPPSITFGPEPSIGVEFTVGVKVTGPLPTGLIAGWLTVGAEFRLFYNDTLLQVVSIEEGPFFRDGPWNLYGTYFAGYIESGDIGVCDLLFPNATTGVYDQTSFPSGTGIIANITFRAIQQDTLIPLGSDLRLDGIGGVWLVDKSSNAVPVDTVANVNGLYTMLPPRDIAVRNVTIAKTVVCQGYSVNVTVKIENRGLSTETFNVTVYANGTAAIGVLTVNNMPNGTFSTVTVQCYTTGLPAGNCTLSAVAGPVPFETLTADNNYIDGWIKITIVGDSNGDGKVNLLDVFSVALAYGSFPGHPTWKPNLDINNDGKINLIDYFMTALNFGKTV